MQWIDKMNGFDRNFKIHIIDNAAHIVVLDQIYKCILLQK